MRKRKLYKTPKKPVKEKKGKKKEEAAKDEDLFNFEPIPLEK